METSDLRTFWLSYPLCRDARAAEQVQIHWMDLKPCVNWVFSVNMTMSLSLSFIISLLLLWKGEDEQQILLQFLPSS